MSNALKGKSHRMPADSRCRFTIYQRFRRKLIEQSTFKGGQMFGLVFLWASIGTAGALVFIGFH